MGQFKVFFTKILISIKEKKIVELLQKSRKLFYDKLTFKRDSFSNGIKKS